MQRITFQRSRGRYKGYFVALAIIKLKRRSKKSKHRRYVLQQWLQTERSFQMDLSLAINYIKKPLLAKQLIDQNGGIILCTAFEQMQALSMEMLTTISVVEKERNMNRIVIGPQLIKFASFYKLTSDYFGNRTKCEKLLKTLFEEHNSEMRQTQALFQQAAKKLDIRKQYMTMAGCLEQPQYRMFKYGLLLKQYVKKMPIQHSDYANIRKAIDLFEQISLNNNDKMARNELAEKKIKLNQFAGRALDSQSQFRIQMSANSLYFPVKLYIFNNLIIITKVERILGFQEERKYLSINLNQFCYVKEKPDGKYYKNGLIICGIYETLHLFTEEPGSRLEIVRTIEKVIRELQINAVNRRRKNKISESNKISFVINFQKELIFAPEIRVEVLHTQVRPLGRLTNDTVYLTRFAAPLWIEDLTMMGLHEDRLQIGQWQLVEVHLSRVMELYETLCKEYPHIDFPKIDPLTKQMNAYTQGKKKTIMYEQRGFLFEEFFNFILRNPTVMKNPIEIIHRHKYLESFWEYLIKKNDYLAGRTQPDKDVPTYLYSGNHCQLCSSIFKLPLSSLQKIRQEAALCGKQMPHCCNASNLLRLRLVAEPQKNFDTIDRILLRQIHEVGRIDYAILPRDELNKRYQQVTIMSCAETSEQIVLIDYRRKVGQIMLDIGSFLGLDEALDHRLILRYEGRQRILDQDEVLFDLINRYKFPVVEREDTSRQSRFSYNITTIEKQQSVVTFFQDVFSSKVDSSLSIRKIIYLPKELQIKAIEKNPRRGKYLVNQLFGRLAKGQISLEPDDWSQACSFWLLLNKYNQLKNSPITHLLTIVTDRLIPNHRKYITHEKSFLKVFGDSIDKARKRNHGLTEKQLVSVYRTIVRIFYRCTKTYTYLTPFTVHTLPDNLISDGFGPIEEQCQLGVNFKEFLVFRRVDSPHPAVKLSLRDIKITCSTFSLFLNYSAQIASNLNQFALESRQVTLRFDGRLMYHFRYMVELYLSLRKIFPNVIV